MRLKSISYKENLSETDANPWELQEITFGERNLIVARNATGKTRISNCIHNLSKYIQAPPALVNGIYQGPSSWECSATFLDELEGDFEYFVRLDKGEVIQEIILVNGEEKLNRKPSSAKIYSAISKKMIEISPPNNRLVAHVRRDKTEFPFLENLISWAEGLRGFSFANTSPNLIEIPGSPLQLISLNAVPSILEQLSATQTQNVLNQLHSMDYSLETASVASIPGSSPIAKFVSKKEQGLNIPLKQFEISQGMFRAFALLTIIEFLKASNKIETILVDDLGEGLDSERSKRLAELIFRDPSASKIQFIATSNDSFLMNTVELDYLTVCYRSNHKVTCLNYSNSKKKFDNWKRLGLNNFDLLSSNFLLD